MSEWEPAERAHEAQVSPARILETCLRFGVPMKTPGLSGGLLDRLGLPLLPGQIVLVTGPSGAGKTRLLAEIARREPLARNVQSLPFPLDVPVVDAVLPARPLEEALRILTACGLGEATLWLRRFDQLSEGERFRARLARAVGQHRRERCAAPLLCDEFGSLLHERLARAIAFNLRKLVSRERLCLVVATCREDLAAVLAPDRVVRLPLPESDWHQRSRSNGSAPCAVSDGTHPLLRGVRIERGTLRDYAALAKMHYRPRERVGFVDRVFVLRDAEQERLGVIVYGRPCLELALRNRVTQGRWVRRAEQLNRELRVIKRVVVHPDLRGCGVGHWLVRETLPLAGAAFVECLAAMGAVNPVFEKAGMVRVGVCCTPAQQNAALRALRAAGADPFAADFVSHVCRRPAVRRVVARSVFAWYRATTGGGNGRVARQTPSFLAQTFRQLAGSQPVYFIWAREAAGWEVISAGLEAMGLAASRDPVVPAPAVSSGA